MAEEQYRVHWDDRAAYLMVLRELKDAVLREMDVVQVGAAATRRLSQAMEATHIAKVRYRQQCQDQDQNPSTAPVPMPPAKKSPRPKRS